MKQTNQWLVSHCFIALALWFGLSGSLLAQSDQRLLLIGVSPGLGVGYYTKLGPNVGSTIRYQHPLTRGLTIVAQTGLEWFRIRSQFVEAYQDEFGLATGFSVPVLAGPRFYFLKGMYGDISAGADIGVSRLAANGFRFEPSFGLVVPLASGKYMEMGTSVGTNFQRGSGVYLFHVLYGVGL